MSKDEIITKVITSGSFDRETYIDILVSIYGFTRIEAEYSVL